MSRIEWLTIATNRTRVKRGFDGGRSSWRLHALRLEDDQQKFSDIPSGTETVCGIRHACGFDLNVFITDRCKRCERILAKVPIRSKRMSRSTIGTFQLFATFPDGETARTNLEGRLWKKGPVCPTCACGDQLFFMEVSRKRYS
jgi:hypothetical protein